MSTKPTKRKWPVKSFTRQDLRNFNDNGLSLYLSDPDRIEFGEMMFWRTAQYIPLSITPNFLTRCGLFFNFLIVVISFGITPAIDGEMGETAQKYIPTAICIVMAILQFTVCALDNWDGLHARGTNQCSDLGALLDHYFDSITLAMNAVAMGLLFNPGRVLNGLAVVCGPLIFNMQLLTYHYLKKQPRVAGPEAQIVLFVVDIVASILFYYQLHGIVMYLGYIVVFLACVGLVKYIILFLPMFNGHSVIWSQLLVFWGAFLVLGGIYLAGWISTFEFSVCGVYISWDYNGQIVTHDILKEKLPLFKPWFLVIPIGVIAEFYYFNPLVWLVDSRNNIHLTTLCFYAVFAYHNVKHHVTMADKLVNKIKKKNAFKPLSG